MAAARDLLLTRAGDDAEDNEEINDAFQNDLHKELPHLHLGNLPLVWFKFIFLYMTRLEVKDCLSPINDSLKCEVLNYKGTDPICPRLEDIWSWADLITPEDVKVVILGLDPYFSYFTRSDGEHVLAATGRGFSLNEEYFKREYQNNWLPYSWKSILRMLMPGDERRYLREGNGDLTNWYRQGVCMLDLHLTTRGKLKFDKRYIKGQQHKHSGWDKLTRLIVERLGEGKEKERVFMFWGKYIYRDLQSYGPGPLNQEHVKVELCHPSACRKDSRNPDERKYCCGLDCWANPDVRNCFSEVNEMLSVFGETIDWNPLNVNQLEG